MFWICMTSGAAGHTYGANGIWQCNRRGEPHGTSPTGGNYGMIPWDEAMNLPGSAQIGAGKRFLEGSPGTASSRIPSGSPGTSASLRKPPGPGTLDLVPRGGRDARTPRSRPATSAGRSTSAGAQGRPAAGSGSGPTTGSRPGSTAARSAPADGWNDPQVFDVTGPARGPAATSWRSGPRTRPRARGHNPAGLIAGLDASSSTAARRPARHRRSWRSSRDEAAGWREAAFDDGPWPLAADLGPLGIAPLGPGRRSPSRPPPLAFGLPDGPRVIYTLDPKPVLLRGLTPDASYRGVEFDPVAGTTPSGGPGRGRARRPAREARRPTGTTGFWA